ncbi:hypothetical protein DY000_02025350 [Brassica cretica]|uniref:DUF4005 domain-containing protein n=1 Tax=Brassica cretica TaxID=69181 RepID=A0ABQ7E8S0_BRACR|nr:hypothetical protein DY000_02025350 [Brassica cretica]
MGTRDWSRDQSRDIKTNNNLRLATCDQSQVACYATAKRTTTCDLRSVAAQGVPDPSSDVRDLRAAPARDLFLVRDSIRQLASDDQGAPDQATKDVCDPIEATRSIPARVPFVSSLRLNSFGGPIQQSSKIGRTPERAGENGAKEATTSWRPKPAKPMLREPPLPRSKAGHQSMEKMRRRRQSRSDKTEAGKKAQTVDKGLELQSLIFIRERQRSEATTSRLPSNSTSK